MNAYRPSSSTFKTAEATCRSDSPEESSPGRKAIRARSEIVGALRLLLAAFNYASDTHIDPWQFAVEIDELRQRGAALTDVRWLVTKGWAEHRREVPVPGDEERSFRTLATTDFPHTTSVVLTD